MRFRGPYPQVSQGAATPPTGCGIFAGFVYLLSTYRTTRRTFFGQAVRHSVRQAVTHSVGQPAGFPSDNPSDAHRTIRWTPDSDRARATRSAAASRTPGLPRPDRRPP